MTRPDSPAVLPWTYLDHDPRGAQPQTIITAAAMVSQMPSRCVLAGRRDVDMAGPCR